MEQKYIKFIAQSKKDYFDLLKSVISIPSPSYKEREIAVKIKDFLEQEAEKNQERGTARLRTSEPQTSHLVI